MARRRGLVWTSIAAALFACAPELPSSRHVFEPDAPACLPPDYAELGPAFAGRMLRLEADARWLAKTPFVDAEGCRRRCDVAAKICRLRARSCALSSAFAEVCEYADVCATESCEPAMKVCEACAAELAPG